MLFLNVSSKASLYLAITGFCYRITSLEFVLCNGRKALWQQGFVSCCALIRVKTGGGCERKLIYLCRAEKKMNGAAFRIAGIADSVF